MCCKAGSKTSFERENPRIHIALKLPTVILFTKYIQGKEINLLSSLSLPFFKIYFLDCKM